jgi:REP element-mobilizing transposase RayT
MVRGIDGMNIVVDDADRTFYVTRMGEVAIATGTTIYAWALMSNHAHILLVSGTLGLSTFMRKLLSGYASYFNRKHKRHGHLFQNRYKSIVCEADSYFLKLVGYIHLNPLRAGLVGTMKELEHYRWSGHAVVMNRIQHEWQGRDEVLRYFGDDESSARKGYQEFVTLESGLGSQPELTGGGLVRSLGGWSEVKSLRKRGERQFSDERILGSSEFVKDVLDDVDENRKEQVPAESMELDARNRLENACKVAGVSVKMLQSGSRVRTCSAVRKDLARELVLEMGMSYAGVARILGISASAVNQILLRDRMLK